MKVINLLLITILIIGFLAGMAWWLLRGDKTDQLFNAIGSDNVAKAKSLIEMGADVNAIRGPKVSKTPLERAIEEGSPEMVALLLKNGAKLSMPEEWMLDPLDVSIKIALGEYIIMSSEPRIPWETVRQNQKKIIPLLMEANASSNYDPEIISAILTDNLDLIKNSEQKNTLKGIPE